MPRTEEKQTHKDGHWILLLFLNSVFPFLFYICAALLSLVCYLLEIMNQQTQISTLVSIIPLWVD